MSEYIVDTTKGILNAKTTGRIVRCRDCKHSATDGEGRYVCMPLRCTTEPGGYCYRGERSEPGMSKYRYVSDSEDVKEG